MAGKASSVERVKDRATGLDKFVLREARGSSAEVTLPSSSPFKFQSPAPLILHRRICALLII
jgi:hypothetical protein